MDVSNLTYPKGYSEPGEGRVAVYEEQIWYNGEVCNNCFQQIRSIGDEITCRKGSWTFSINEWYERTDYGSQEHDPFTVAADRYGQCYCLDCGADTKAENADLSMDVLTERGKNILRYVNARTAYDVNGTAMGRALRELKQVPENQGYDSEILAVATIVGIFADRRKPSRAAVVG